MSASLKLFKAPGPSARHRYDLWDNLVAVTDARNNVTTYAYDDFNNMIRKTYCLAEKTYSITGWRFSYTIAPTGISERIKKVRDQRAGQWAQGTIR